MVGFPPLRSFKDMSLIKNGFDSPHMFLGGFFVNMPITCPFLIRVPGVRASSVISKNPNIWIFIVLSLLNIWTS